MNSTEKGTKAKIDPTTPSHDLIYESNVNDYHDEEENYEKKVKDGQSGDNYLSDAFLLSSSDDECSKENNADNNFAKQLYFEPI